jgi:carboxymethylenebutenolidase
MRTLLTAILLLAIPQTPPTPAALPTPASPPTQAAAPAPTPPPAAPAPAPRDPNLPPSEAQAKAALDSSPRHGEYVDIKLPGGGVPIRTWVVYPERKDRAGVVILVHEIFGLSDWLRGVADQVARDGFIAVAPDLVSGMGPNGGGTASAASRDDVVALVRNLTPEMATARLDAVRAWAVKLPPPTARAPRSASAGAAGAASRTR